MEKGGGSSSSRWWTVFSLVGIVLWIGATVYAATQLDDPSDPAPVLRTFAVAGGCFFAVMFGAAAVQMRRSGGNAIHELYHRLALHPIAPSALRRAARGTRTIGYVYLVFGAVTTGLMLTGIGVADDEWFGRLAWTAVGLVILWAVYAIWALRRAYQAGDDMVAPLGLRITATPVYLPRVHGGGGDLSGALVYEGERHGRSVTITQAPTLAVTAVGHTGDVVVPTSPEQMAALTGEPTSRWRRVAVAAEDGSIAVRRTGNGAGRWFLHDLLLAESVTGSSSRT